MSGPSPLPSTLATLLPRCSQGEVDLLESVLDTLELLVNKNGICCVCLLMFNVLSHQQPFRVFAQCTYYYFLINSNY